MKKLKVKSMPRAKSRGQKFQPKADPPLAEKVVFLKFLLFTFWFLLFGCAHPMYEAQERAMTTVSRVFDTDANQAYYAVRWALKTDGYSITSEDLENGVVTSGWLPAKADTFYVDPFGPEHKDYGANGAYYKLEVKIVPEENTSKTRVEISSRVKSMVAHLKSSEIQEKRILKKVSDYLRKPDIRVTNIGVEE